MCHNYGLFNDLYVISDPTGNANVYCTDAVDIGMKSISYRNRNPFINISKYSYIDDDINVNPPGIGTVVPEPVITVVVKYLTSGLTNG